MCCFLDFLFASINNCCEEHFIIEIKDYQRLLSKIIEYIEIHLFSKNSAHCFEDLTCTNKLEEFFFDIFVMAWSFFHNWKTTHFCIKN